MLTGSYLLMLVYVSVGVGLAILAFAFRPRSVGSRLARVSLAVVLMLPAGVLFLVANPWVYDARHRSFRTFHRSIDTGMTRDDVLGAMRRCYPPEGDRFLPVLFKDDPDSLGFFMNREGRPGPNNCEAILVDLEDGVVTRVRYSPD